MVECYISANSKYELEKNTFYKSGAILSKADGSPMDELTFKSLIYLTMKGKTA